MHEIYMLAVLFNASRHRTAEPTREQRLRDEQAFYERHSGDRGPRFKGLARFAPAVRRSSRAISRAPAGPLIPDPPRPSCHKDVAYKPTTR